MNCPKCALCGGEAAPYSSAPHYFGCENCGFVFLDRTKVVSRPDEKERYLKHTNGQGEAGYAKMLEEFIKICVTPFTHAPGPALDYGSGPKPVLAGILEKRGYKVDIYDPFFAPATNFDPEKYGIVTAVEVIEHMKCPLSDIRIIADILKPGGIFAGRTMFLAKEDFALWWYRFDITHISFYSRESLSYIALETGMKAILFKEPCFFVMKKNG
ncbi:MAG: hypothetical protein CVU78_07425 [Elusimicrobia bacterium HGW-Elusimicrobia-2]|nr:MAG: hypothetical protein CVU78_07425 [Elusimicrobia bacterium HGW-Elusimicrobia-2]